jgi:hypothetical protein
MTDPTDRVVNSNLTMRYGIVDEQYARRLATTPPDEDGPVWMVNLMKYRPVADYADGRESPLTGEQADDVYAPFDSLAAVGAELVFLATVDTQLLGRPPAWDRVAVVKYPTRRAFHEMQWRADFEAAHVHKDAGMEHTIVMAGVPIHQPPLPPDAPAWADVPHPPTADDPYVVVLHVLQFHEPDPGVGSWAEMREYTNHAALTAVPHGVRIAGWFGVEGTIIGDGRPWHEARFNAFPSKAAFMDVVFDPARLEAQKAHREVALADTYTMILRPVIDHLTQPG